MKTPFHIATALILSACALSSQAAEQGAPLADCVTLGNQQEVVRGGGGGNRFFLKDGDSHYGVRFRRSCDSIATTSKVEISTADQMNRLCPQDTRVKTDRDICEVGEIQQISAEEFARRKKRARS
ncbi:hypothetical protein [Pseudoxanthomonas sp. UTMC 1351]|uniref:hypothetical protein n=1 Tax=Pseudoxanthomonas sp. UTMC 1351 TaxID=2695853 RepID=UPI0034CF71A4